LDFVGLRGAAGVAVSATVSPRVALDFVGLRVEAGVAVSATISSRAALDFVGLRDAEKCSFTTSRSFHVGAVQGRVKSSHEFAKKEFGWGSETLTELRRFSCVSMTPWNAFCALRVGMVKNTKFC
jgi:hypothetical protein